MNAYIELIHGENCIWLLIIGHSLEINVELVLRLDIQLRAELSRR